VAKDYYIKKTKMNKLKLKLEEIIDFELSPSRILLTKNDIQDVAKRYKLTFPENYIFYLQFFGNDYVKDNYVFTPIIELPKHIRDSHFDISAIFGLYDGVNNLEIELKTKREFLPVNLFPIADFGGGDLVCMDKENYKIYLWFHEENEGEDVCLVAENFEDFIINFNFEKPKQFDLDSIQLHFSPELDMALKKAAEKYER